MSLGVHSEVFWLITHNYEWFSPPEMNQLKNCEEIHPMNIKYVQRTSYIYQVSLKVKIYIVLSTLFSMKSDEKKMINFLF